jgi:hypothetical protein
VGQLTVAVHETGALPVWIVLQVVEEAVYDALFAASATGLLPANVTQWLGTAAATPTVAGVPEVDLTHVAGATTNVAALATNVDAILTDTGTTLQAELDGIQADTEDIQARLPAALVSGRIDASVGAMAANVMTAAAAAADLTTELQSGLATAASITALNNLSAAQVNAEVDTALADINLDHLVKIAVDTDFPTTVHLNSVVGYLADNGTAASYDRATDSQEAIRDNMGTAQTGDAFARLGAPAGASVSADIAAIEAQTDDIGAAGAGLTAVPWNAAWDAEVQSEVADALAVYDPPTKAELDTGLDALPTAAENADAVWDEATTGHATSGTFGQALVPVRAGTAQAGAATTITLDAGASASDDFYNNHLLVITAGTGAGQARFITDYVGATKVATVATWVTNPDATSVFVLLPFSAIPGATAPTAAQVADAVWEEAIADHSGTAGSTAEALNAAGSAGDPWVTALPGAYGAGSAGKIVGDNLNATVSSRASQASVDAVDDFLDTEVAAILADTNELQTDWANGGRLDLILDARASQTSVDDLPDDIVNYVPGVAQNNGSYDMLSDIRAKTDQLTFTSAGKVDATIQAAGDFAQAAADKVWSTAARILTAVTGFNDLSAANVNTEVVDALAVDTYAEPGQATPAATATLATKIGYLYKMMRNRKTQTATQFSLYNDDAVTVDQKATVADDGVTASVTELATGP